MNIREYAEQQQRYLRHETSINWYDVFESAGYHHVIPGMSNWREMHNWLKDKIGEFYYIWHGEHFWFETEEDAMVFALRWA